VRNAFAPVMQAVNAPLISEAGQKTELRAAPPAKESN